MLYFICYFKNQLLLLTFQCTLGAFCTTCHIVIFLNMTTRAWGIHHAWTSLLNFFFFFCFKFRTVRDAHRYKEVYTYFMCSCSYQYDLYYMILYKEEGLKNKTSFDMILLLSPHYFFYDTKTNGSLLRLWYYWYTEATSHKNYWKRA